MEIRLKQAGKKIRGVVILENICLTMQSGFIYGLQGENGSGKTMLMRLICGLMKATEGGVYVNGKLLRGENNFPQKTGILIENPAFLKRYTGLKNLCLLASLKNEIHEQEIRNTLLRVGLNPDDRRKYRKYSLGMKQKLGIAAALMERPELLILDEPLNALDERSAENIKKIILEEKERGALIIMACHDGRILEELADVKVVLSGGRITEVVVLDE